MKKLRKLTRQAEQFSSAYFVMNKRKYLIIKENQLFLQKISKIFNKLEK